MERVELHAAAVSQAPSVRTWASPPDLVDSRPATGTLVTRYELESLKIQARLPILILRILPSPSHVSDQPRGLL